MRGLGRRYYDLNSGAVIIAYVVIAAISFLFGYFCCKLI